MVATTPIEELSPDPGRRSKANPGRSASVVSGGDVVARLVLWSPGWDAEALRQLRAQLASGPPNRRLIFVEPVPDIGWRRRLQRLGRRLWRTRLGYSFERDLPAELRTAGFTIDTLDRFSIGRLGLRTYAYGEALSCSR